MLDTGNQENKRRTCRMKLNTRVNFFRGLKKTDEKKNPSNQELLSVMMSGFWVNVKCVDSSTKRRLEVKHVYCTSIVGADGVAVSVGRG